MLVGAYFPITSDYCLLGNFACFKFCCGLLIFFKIIFFKNCFGNIPSECQTIWIQIRPNILSVLIWVQTVCKGYQQTTQVGKGLVARKLKVLIFSQTKTSQPVHMEKGLITQAMSKDHAMQYPAYK